MSEEKSLISKNEFLYNSRTEYDLDNPKKIDLRIGIAHELIIEKTKDEKIQVIAATIIVLTNRDMFFEKRHIGHILE